MINSISHNSIDEHEPASNGAVVIGKIYATWCGHCVALESVWENVKTRMEPYVNNGSIVFEEIEQSEENSKLPLINNSYLMDSNDKLAVQGGYPTIFCIRKKSVEYYHGARDENGIYEWSMSKMDNASLKPSIQIVKDQSIVLNMNNITQNNKKKSKKTKRNTKKSKKTKRNNKKRNTKKAKRQNAVQ